jgi:hypothetical protein
VLDSPELVFLIEAARRNGKVLAGFVKGKYAMIWFVLQKPARFHRGPEDDTRIRRTTRRIPSDRVAGSSLQALSWLGGGGRKKPG